jgi:hypothetical protein
MSFNISLCYFSTLFSKGYKSEQIKEIIKEFKNHNVNFNCYILDYSTKYTFVKKVESYYVSSLPFYINKIYKKFRLYHLYPSYFNYLYSEKIYSFLFSDLILKDESRVVILKNRPHSLVKKIRNNTNKIVVIESDQQHPMFTNSVVEKELNKYNIKFDNIYTNKKAIKDYTDSFDFADLIIVYTERQRNILLEYGVKSKIFINELGLESLPKFKLKSKEELVKKKYKFITFANHSILKGTHKLVELWGDLPNNFELIIAGSIEPDFKFFLNSFRNISANISFIETFNKDNLLELSKDYNLIGILLSLSEAYPRVVSEYFEFGIPVVVSQIIDRDVDKFNFGMVVEYDNVTEIKSALCHLIIPENYYECHKNIFNYNFKTYSDFAKKYLKTIKSLIDE